MHLRDAFIGLCIFEQLNKVCIMLAKSASCSQNTCKMFQKDSKIFPKYVSLTPKHDVRTLTLNRRSSTDLRTPPLPPLRGEGIIGGAWGSSEAGTPHGQRGWGSKRPSPAAALHCFCRTRNLNKGQSRANPCLLPDVVPPFVGARHA